MNSDREGFQRIPILDIARKLGINVKKKNAMCFKGHDRRTPSLFFSPEKNLWHCFGCGSGGNNIMLVKEYYGYSSKEAIIWLKQNFGIAPSYKIAKRGLINNLEVRDYKIEAKQSYSDPEIYKVLLSKCSLSSQGRQYLINRGYNEKIINCFCIKDIINIKEIQNLLITKFDIERLLKSGVMVKRQGRPCLIWWDHTILFPFFERGKVVYVQGRRLKSTPPKYIGLSGIQKPLYNRDTLINLSTNSTVFICEGVTDTLTAIQFGFNAVGVLGALSFRKEWVDDLKKFRIIVLPDNDQAGRLFEKKVQESFLEKGHVVEIIRVARGKDLSDLLQRKKNVAHK